MQTKQQIDAIWLADEPRLRRLQGDIKKRSRQDKPTDRLQAKFSDMLAQSRAKVAARRQAVPRVTYPDLPVAREVERIRAALLGNQVIVVAGETGSGKTTQLPKLCLEAGRGIHGLVGHTQPRRLAARTVAQRIASELQSELGAAVGYQVRFHDQVSDGTYIKLMTDGILLAEIQHDPYLYRYDTLIILSLIHI